MSTQTTPPPDIVTMVCTRPVKNQTITVTIPEAMVQMLDWLAANTKNPDGTNRYLYGLNVIWHDVIECLLPMWKQRYSDGQVAPLQTQIDAQRQAIQGSVAAGVAALTVTGDEALKPSPTPAPGE